MLTVKVSTPWSHIDYNNRISNQYLNKNYRFDFSDAFTSCDIWIIWGGIKNEEQQAFCPPQNVIYLTDEVHNERFFYKKFLEQFAAIITCRTDLQHKQILPCHELNTWMVDRSFDFLSANHNVPKSKMLSVVCSDQTWLQGHKLRYAFVNKLIGHFKDKIDVFGRGFNPVSDKYEALAPYKYSIAIENSVIPGYFTEKISDCYLTHTLPVYYGCPDITNYFDSESLELINPLDFKSSVLKIEQLMEDDLYSNRLPAILKAKANYLNNYHIFNKLPKLLEENFIVTANKKNICIKAESSFHRGYKLNNIVKVIQQKLPFRSKYHFQFLFNQADLYSNIKK